MLQEAGYSPLLAWLHTTLSATLAPALGPPLPLHLCQERILDEFNYL